MVPTLGRMREHGTVVFTKRAALIATGAVAVAAVATVVVVLSVRPPAAPAASTSTPTVTRTASPTPTPTPTGPAADTAVYDTSALPRDDVFAVIPALAVDADPQGAFTGLGARAIAAAVPVFAAPGTPPVAALYRDASYGGETVPVIDREQNWVQVLLTGRQALPSAGDPAQVTGWLRVADVQLAPLPDEVVVSLTDRTIDIVRAGQAQRIATDFASGAAQTPTPTGRAFVMMVRAVPGFSYTRGHPIVYLSVQSPALDGFDGANVAVAAFHYHDDHSGDISNGCIRLDAAAIDALAVVPPGTPVVIRR